ncbi:hypothetical protein Aab01nite_43630 [Paractinoplanes abujensis]|uniref:Tetratricopeptide (TPR) repeat protein n=1 Tax=Paractinoplanes abujensis TaxID=882441 RepID=A0A7W7CK76_9ACTN|nr:tetratricopeptide repeat protein [Actinoplanes abujensis]MBB4690000.1 tetratricopeptide (TPR) repeat protein [Actinoplanes abujensis]GID20773.1 hypothetical protein Aab01nite_43630 [Actinoplanes abujensis]
MSTWLRPRFVGIGVENYRHGHGRLPAARWETERLHELLADQVDGTVLGDPAADDVRALLEQVRLAGSAQPVILAWSGHGQVFNGEVRLLTTESDGHPGTGLPLSELVLSIAASGTSQLLCIIDVCFAGAGAFKALQTAALVFSQERAGGQPWAGMLASAGPGESAVDGLFGRHLHRVLRRGSTDPAQRLFWSGAYVTGDAIGNAMQVAMPPSRDGRPVQRVLFARVGLPASLLRNPSYDAAVREPARPVDRIVAGDRGTLIGRASAVQVVRSWAGSDQPGLRVLTGPPASGKTAILTHAAGRAAAVFVDARGRTPDQIRGQLPVSGCPVIVVDGLDEAGEHSRAIAEQVLIPLATRARVIVGTRDIGYLVAVLDPVALLDLEAPEQVAEAGADLRAYVLGRLAEVMEPGAAARLTDEVTAGAPTFLLAHRLTEQLRAGHDLPASVHALLAADLDTAEPPEHRVPLPPGLTPGGLARHLLATLAWSYGAGFGEQEWIVVAAATAPAGLTVDRDDLLWLLGQLGHLVVQDRTAGVVAYRLAHETLAGELGAYGSEGGEARAVTVAVALLERYRAVLEGGIPGTEPGYLWDHAWRHAIDAGDLAVGRLHDLASSTPALRSRAALAEAGWAARLRSAGRRTAAIPHAEAAVRLSSALPEQPHALATALDNLAVTYRDAGRPEPAAEAASRAVTLFRGLRSDDPMSAADLAGALTNLAVCRAEAGPAADAVAAGTEAAGLFRELAGRTAAYHAEVAMTLTNVGIAQRRAGDIGSAHESVREAVRLYRSSPGAEAGLASALGGLSECLRQLDRQGEAHAAAEEAVRLSRAAAGVDPAARPRLAVALTALAECHLALGQAAAAVAPAREAVTLLRAVAAREPAFRPHWGRALTLLSATLSGAPATTAARQAVELLATVPGASGRAARADALLRLASCRRADGDLDEAETLAQRAVGADDTRADAWSALATIRRRRGRPRHALPAAEKAVALLRAAVAERPDRRAALAAALTNLAVAQHDCGRIDAATAGLEEAAGLRRRLARGPVGLDSLAAALDRLTAIYLDGWSRSAVETAAEAVERHRELGSPAAIGPALIRLAWACLQADQPARALSVAREAADLGSASPVRADALAAAGQAHLRLGQTGAAATALSEAIDRGAEDVAAALTAYERVGGDATARDLWARLIDRDPVRGLLSRASAAEPGDLRAAEWLAAVAGRPGLDRAGTAVLHEQGRRHRAPDPDAFDRAWGEPAPGWLTVDAGLVAQATEWLLDGSSAVLEAHPGLLAAEADLAVREAMWALSPEEAEEMAGLRAEAAAVGIAAAGRARRSRDLAERFVAASPAGKRALLEAERAGLLDPAGRTLVATRDALSAAVLDLADREAHGPVLLALDRPDPETTLVRLLDGAEDDLTIGPVAEVLAAVAATGGGRLAADFYRAVGQAVTGLAPDVANLAGRPGPVADLLRAGAAVARRHPAVLPVMLALTGDDTGTALLRPAP